MRMTWLPRRWSGTVTDTFKDSSFRQGLLVAHCEHWIYLGGHSLFKRILEKLLVFQGDSLVKDLVGIKQSNVRIAIFESTKRSTGKPNLWYIGRVHAILGIQIGSDKAKEHSSI